MNGTGGTGDNVQRDGMASNAWMVPANLWWLRARAFWARIARLGRSNPRRLRLAETLPLGERRFVAVLEFEEFRFLLGGTASSLVLLARLDAGIQESRSSLEVTFKAAKAAEAGRL
jgi:flagellar biogenesis protein FliO